MASRHSTDIDAQIGARVKMRRLQVGLSQTALADRLGMTFQQIQKYERGTNRIACGNLIELARVLDTSTNWLLGENEDAGNVLPGAFDSESLKLLSLFKSIPDPNVRQRVSALISALLDAEPPQKGAAEDAQPAPEGLVRPAPAQAAHASSLPPRAAAPSNDRARAPTKSAKKSTPPKKVKGKRK